MTVAPVAPARADRTVTLRLPRPRGTVAPVAAARMRRALLVYGVLWLVGLAPTVLGAGAGLRAAGLGLTFPGGGLLASGHPIWFAVAIVAFVLAVLVWWFAGPTVLPPLVVAVAAVLAGTTAETITGWATTAVPAVVPLALLTAYVVHRVRHRRQVATARALDDRLAAVEVTIPGPLAADASYPVAVSDDEDLTRLRYALDLALQSHDAFEGFTKIDQYREAATRYQLNALGYALSMAQLTRTPAFAGYLAEGQRNAIEKILDRRVWGYWARENLWGNLRWDPDPVDNPENIMLTGFHGVMCGMYETLNDDRYSQPGALTYRWSDGRDYPNDFGTLAASIDRNQRRSPFSLIACEPNWVYTICNTFGLNTLVAHDRLRGTGYADAAVERIGRAYETEFMRPDGRIIGVRAAHLGLSWNFWAGEAVQLQTSFWLHACLPEIAHRTWWLLRERALKLRDARLDFPTYPTAGLDPGNYKLGRDTFAQVGTALTAREIGDEAYAQAAEATLAEREPVQRQAGAARWKDASTLANLYGLVARFGRAGGVRDLIAHGVPDAWRSGPRLAEAAYPDVLVAHAVTDGAALELELVPGDGPVQTTLRLDRLRPGARYDAGHEIVVADAAGEALLTLPLDARRRVRVVPVP